jgi:hypothetical protein
LDRWRLGGRIDVLSLFAKDFVLSGQNQDFGVRPYRLTASLEFNPSEFSRLRLQYEYDRTNSQGRPNNQIFLQAIMAIGAHGAHSF